MFYLLPEIYQMKRNLRTSRERLDRIRLGLLRAQVRNIYENVPFYRGFFEKQKLLPTDFRDMSDLERLPIITKEDVRKDVESFLNKNMNPKTCRRSHTSGSTGEPFSSYFDKRSWVRKKYLSKLRARFACGMQPGEKVAIFESDSAINLEVLNRRMALGNPLLKVVYFSIFEKPAAALEKLIEFMPENLYGPPSYFFHLAQIVEEKKRSLPSVSRIFTSSEYHESPIFQFIRNVLNADIFDVYGSTEFKEVAWECEQHHGYHINEDEVVCEVVNGNNSVRTGAMGEIVLTDLRNHMMPLIRYRINDRGKILGRPCGCGRSFSLMHPVAGRASEYILLPNGEKLSPFLLTTSIEQCDGLLQYQIVQETESDLVVNIIVKDKRDRKVFSAIERILRDVTNGLMRISVRERQRILVEENGKFKVVKNLIQGEFS